MVLVLIMVAVLQTLLLLSTSFSYVAPQETIQLVLALYVFGNSTVDGGNTNPIPQVRHGIDLNANIPIRWGNGKIIAYFIATYLGLPIVLPFKTMAEVEISRTGVNYTYGGSGRLPDTCTYGVKCASFDIQICNFNSTITYNQSKTFNEQDLVQHLADSIFLISFGINDYNVHYPPYGTNSLSYLEADDFAELLLKALAQRLKILYELGARKFLVNNIWPLGCAPAYNSQPDPLVANDCNDMMNEFVCPYSNRLPMTLEELQFQLSRSVFSHSNDFEFVTDLKANPAKYWISNTTGSCFSFSDARICPNRDKYLYFDLVHTTEATNKVFSLNCFNETLCSPT